MRLLLVDVLEPLHDELREPGHQEQAHKKQTETPITNPIHQSWVGRVSDSNHVATAEGADEPDKSGATGIKNLPGGNDCTMPGPRGFEILRRTVPLKAVDGALRHLHLDLVERGASAQTISEWLWGAHWFPHLRWDKEIVALVRHLPARLRAGELCDPQIVLQFPDVGPEAPLECHVDHEPVWANGRAYARIVGIALTPNRASNGGLAVWPLDGGDVESVELEAGDAVVMHPSLPHASQRNREGAIRYAVYFRFLTPA